MHAAAVLAVYVRGMLCRKLLEFEPNTVQLKRERRKIVPTIQFKSRYWSVFY
jgi:hypothetical protein